MQTVRCYLPLSREQLQQIQRERRLAGPLPATAVTEAVRADAPEADEEECEDLVAHLAADRLVSTGMPVVLAAADIPAGDVRVGEGPWVEVAGLALPRVAALYLGDDVITGDRGALPPPEEDVELSWFDTTEVDQVIDLMSALPTPSPPP